jgi:hypothetical protein
LSSKEKKEVIVPTNEDRKNEIQTTPASLININKIITTPTPTPTTKNCIPGQYLENNDCKICPAGSYCINNEKFPCTGSNYSPYGSSICSSKCPSGYIKNKDNNKCELCRLGYYANLDQTDCVPCPAGEYGKENLKGTSGETLKYPYNDCQKCPPGKFSTSGSTECKYDSTSCPKGTYSGSRQACLLNCGTNFADSSNGYGICTADCINKYKRKYTNSEDNKFCLPKCPAGTKMYTRDSYVCSKCINNTYRAEVQGDLNTDRCLHQKTTCPEGTYSYSDGTKNACLSRCPAGYYGLGKECLKCKNGYSIEGSTGITDVSGCKFTEDNCPAGTYADSSKLACVSCVGDSYSTKGSKGKNNEEGCKYKSNTCPIGTKPGINNDCI